MKITQLFKIYWPDNGGGIARVMESIADSLPDCEHQIIVCRDSGQKRSMDDSYRGIPVRRCRQLFDLASTPVSPDFLHEVKKCTRDSDIVIYHFPYPMADLAVLFGMYSGRLVVWWHCGFEKYAGLAPFYRPLVRHTLKKADLILASSGENIRNEALLRRFRQKCKVVPFCVSDACLQRGRAHAAGLLRESPGEKGQIRILFIGRLVWYKGCDVLLEAFAGMKHKNCRLVLVGGGPLETELKELSDSLMLADAEFAGMVSEEEKMRRIEECDFLVLPSVSRAEAFAVVQIEAMAFGKPVINTALPSGVPHVSVDGVTGITVKPGSAGELAEAMDRLAGDADLRRVYGRNALERVQKLYTQQAMAERYRKVFRQLPGDRPFRIAFDGQLLLAGDRTGIAWNAHNLLTELLKHPGIECTLQCFKGRRAAGGMRRLEEYRKAGCRIECCSRFRYTGYKLLWAVFPVPYRFFFRTKADVTQFFNYAVPPGARGKRVTFIYDMAYKACPQTLGRKTLLWLKLCMKKTCRHADHIVTVSGFSKREIARYLKVPEEKISVVPCAVDHAVYHPGYPEGQIREVLDRLGIRREYFLYVGTIEPRKNLERLIRAYAMLCRSRRRVPQLVLAGKKGWLCGGIYETVHRLGMEKRVLFTGYVRQEDSPVLMCGAAAFVFPSLYEGFGMPPLEAMACGTPVITSNTTALREVAADAGLTVDPENEKEICGAMRRVLEDSGCREELRRKGIERAGEYTWEKSAAMLVDVYKRLLGTDGRGSCGQ